MGIGINVGTKQDYSYLFQGLSSGSLGNLNMLSDYASIKNGSYGRLMKAYYGGVGSSGTSSYQKGTGSNNIVDQIIKEKMYPTVSKETQEANAHLTEGITNLKNTVSTLQNEKTYAASEDGTSAADKVASALKDYVSQYNDVVSTSKNSTLTNKTSHIAAMMRSSQTNADKLAEVGITINGDGTLQLNEEKLKTTDISKVQELFSKDNIISYGSVVKSRLGFASVSAGPVQSTETEKAEEDKTTYEGASALKKDIEKLTSDSLFEKKKDKDGTERYDTDGIFAVAKDFVGNYNRMLDMAGSSFNSGVTSNLTSIMEKTQRNKNALEEFGISVDSRGRMTIDKDAFEKSDMDQVQKFFKDYGSSISANVSLVNYYMTTQAGAESIYTADGAYNAWGGLRFNAAI